MKKIKGVREVVKERISIDAIRITRKCDVVIEQARDYNNLPFILNVCLRLNEIAETDNIVIYNVSHDFTLDEKKGLETLYNEVMKDAEEYIFSSRRKLDLAIDFAKRLGLTEIYVTPADC